MNILVSGSLAYDRIMDYPGKFSDHIMPEKVHMLNVCFMINDLKENFGGTAGNIAYALSLLGEDPTVIATAGRDFGPYRNWLSSKKMSTEHIKIINEELTAGAYITTDQSDNQITAFNPGAMKFSSSFDFDSVECKDTIAIVSPGNLDDMYNFSNIYKQKGIDYIFDPGQSIPAWTPERLAETIDGSLILICNDYELQLAQDKTSMSTEDILKKAQTLIKTKGDSGSEIMLMQNNKIESTNIPVAKAGPVKDPTGAGDAYRGGLIKGLVSSKNDITHAAKIGAACSAYTVEVHGTQNYQFTTEAFNKRFEDAFGERAF